MRNYVKNAVGIGLFCILGTLPSLASTNDHPEEYFALCTDAEGYKFMFPLSRDFVLSTKDFQTLERCVKQINKDTVRFLAQPGTQYQGIVTKVPLQKSSVHFLLPPQSYHPTSLPQSILQALWQGNGQFIQQWIQTYNAFDFVGEGELRTSSYISGFSGWRILDLAMLYDLPDLVDWLLQQKDEQGHFRINPNQPYQNSLDDRLKNVTSFTVAIALGRQDFFDKLNQQTAFDPKHVSQDGYTYLHNAIGFFDDTLPDMPGIVRRDDQVFKYFIRDHHTHNFNPCLKSIIQNQNINVNMQTTIEKETPLHMAVLTYNPDIVACLLQRSGVIDSFYLTDNINGTHYTPIEKLNFLIQKTRLECEQAIQVGYAAQIRSLHHTLEKLYEIKGMMQQFKAGHES